MSVDILLVASIERKGIKITYYLDVTCSINAVTSSAKVIWSEKTKTR